MWLRKDQFLGRVLWRGARDDRRDALIGQIPNPRGKPKIHTLDVHFLTFPAGRHLPLPYTSCNKEACSGPGNQTFCGHSHPPHEPESRLVDVTADYLGQSLIFVGLRRAQLTAVVELPETGCPKCGQSFAVHNDDGSCVVEQRGA